MTKKRVASPQVPPGAIAVLDSKGNLRGVVGPSAIAWRVASKVSSSNGKGKGERDSWSFPK